MPQKTIREVGSFVFTAEILSEAASLHYTNGLSWPTIADHFKCLEVRRLSNLARLHRIGRWDNKDGRLEKERMEISAMLESGMSPLEIAKVLRITARAVRMRICTIERLNELGSKKTLPMSYPTDDLKRANELRAQHNLSWEVIATRLGYSYVAGLRRAAARFRRGGHKGHREKLEAERTEIADLITAKVASSEIARRRGITQRAVNIRSLAMGFDAEIKGEIARGEWDDDEDSTV